MLEEACAIIKIQHPEEVVALLVRLAPLHLNEILKDNFHE